jgi:hypothetical protein
VEHLKNAYGIPVTIGAPPKVGDNEIGSGMYDDYSNSNRRPNPSDGGNRGPSTPPTNAVDGQAWTDDNGFIYYYYNGRWYPKQDYGYGYIRTDAKGQ